MNYLEWNNLIGSHLFNETVAGKEVYLFLTREDIIQVGKEHERFSKQGDDLVWDDFIRAIRNGIPGESRQSNHLDKIQVAFSKKAFLRIGNVEILYPPYLGYLALTVLPVLEFQGEQTNDPLRANNYYSRINNFLQKNGLPTLPIQKQAYNWNPIWQHLSDWSIKTKKTDLGIFKVRNFSPTWKYAGIPLSQCLIDPRALKRLPGVFLKEGLVPNSFVSDGEWRKLLTRVWEKDLHQRYAVLEHICREDDEMGKLVLEIVKRSYNHWNGEIEVEEESTTQQTIKRIRKEGIRARLFLSFKLDRGADSFKWGCRMFSKNDYPEDLSFEGQPCFESRENWSNQLELGFIEKTTLKDPANKWEAVLPEKDLRFFIGGAALNLASDYWIETDEINRISPMRLLCKNSKKELVEKWGKHFQAPGRFNEFSNENFDGIPEGWSLFEFQFPKEELEGTPATLAIGTKRIILVGGAKLGTRTYLQGCLPEIAIENADGLETVFLELTTDVNKVVLNKKAVNEVRWVLPATLRAGDEFVVSVGAEKTYPFKIAAETIESLILDNTACPKRNCFGVVDENEHKCFVQGSLVQGFDFKRQHIYIHHFQPVQKAHPPTQAISNNYSPANDLLLEFLTRKKTSHSGEFFEAFEQILYSKISGELEDEKVNLTMLKRQVLNWYDFLGYVDFDYKSKRIVVNPPQMFLLPTLSGRKALLTGARTPDFVEKIFENAGKSGLHTEVVEQAGADKPWFLLPDTLLVNTDGLPGYGMEELKSFAANSGIYFDPEHIAQWGLLHFSAGIDDYAKSLCPDERFEDWDWSRKIFNPDTFRFERQEDDEFDKSYTLLEYQLNAYTYRHILWKDGKAYPVDKSWGRWLVLKHLNKQVIFRDKNGATAIPAGMPLPRLISEALLLCSGRVPVTKNLNLNGIKAHFSLFGNVVKIMLDNEFSRIGQTSIEINQTF